jgi:hypothetical protein
MDPTPDEFKDRNTCYYRGTPERNAQRMTLLSNPAELERLAGVLTRFMAAANEFEKDFGLHADVVDGYDMIRALIAENGGLPYGVTRLESISKN